MFGSILSAGANILGGFLGKKSAEDAKDANVANAALDRELQKEFAQHGIRWRVADAKKAGLHPLAALGAQVSSPSPTMVGAVGDNSFGAGIAAAGQDLSRAINATRTNGERAEAFADLQLENAKLQNDLLASQIAKINQTGTPPPFPGSRTAMPGQGDSGIVQVDPSRRTSTMPGHPAVEAAISPATKTFINRDGTLTVWPSKDAKESVEDSWYEYEHMYRNRIIPGLREFWSDAQGLFSRRSPRVYRSKREPVFRNYN